MVAGVAYFFTLGLLC